MPIPERVLRNTQKADLHSYLHSKGLSPGDFTLTEDNPSVYLRHRFSDYGCTIIVGRFAADGYAADATYRFEYSPGRELLQETELFHTWNSLLEGFDAWTGYLVDELATPDLWSNVPSDAQLIRLAADQDNRPYTPEEQLQVKKALDEIKSYIIQSQQLSENQAKMIEGRFQYMEEAASRLGRKDYIGIVVTTLLTIAYDQGFSRDVSGDVIRFAGQIFKQLLGMLYLAGPH